MITIQVSFQSNGQPAANQKVQLEFTGFTRMGFAKTTYTDNSGRASFDTDSGNGRIYVSGRQVFQGRIESGLSFRV